MTAEVVSTAPTPDDRIRAALWFAGHGFGIFPVWSTSNGQCRCPAGPTCTSPGKHPITPNGFKDATTDERKIRTFLAAGSQPNYGMVPPEGVFVWDVDTDEERARLASLEAAHGPLPPTLRDDTGNGQHLFLRWPDALPRPIHKMFGFVTRWGSGSEAMRGYVVGPLSVHQSGRVYRSAKGSADTIATLPEAWARAAVADESSTITIRGPRPAEDVQVGGRHDWLRDRARWYAGTIRDPDVLFAAVWAENEKLSAPKTREEVRRAIGDALTKFAPDPVEQDPETGETRRIPDDDIGMLPPEATGNFPMPPTAVAYGGLLGGCTIAIARGTDAAMVGLLGSVLAFAGALVPGQAYQHRMQTTSPFIALVGESSVGRKGTAMWRAHDAFADALEATFVNRVILDGLNSGEGLISTLAWKQATFPYEPTVGLVFEEEYASLLASRSRDGSTLDPKMRAAWDGGPLSNRRSNDTKTVTPPYWLPALIAITPDELRRRLGADAMQSGSANRWLYLPVVRREVETGESEAPRFDPDDRKALQDARRWALDQRPVLGVEPAVTRLLTEYQDFLPKVSHGTARDLTRRLPMTAFRVALTHAVAERSSTVTIDHADRALALTEYARNGIEWVFAGAVGNRDAALLLRALRQAGSLTKHTITRQVVRDPIRQQDAIDELVRLGYAVVETIHQTGGRTRTVLSRTSNAGAFVHFVQGSAIPQGHEGEIPGRNGRKSVNGLDETWTHVDETGRNSVSGLDATDVIDLSTGEVATTTTGDWYHPCGDYTAHQDHHRNTPKGWVCTACEALLGHEEETSA